MRTELVQAISEAFGYEGYQFYRGFVYNISQTELQLPCVWLNPVEVSGVTGRNEGLRNYKVTLYLFVPGDGYSEDQKELIWSQLEAKAFASCNKLRDTEFVQDITKITIAPDEFAYTGLQELSIKVSFETSVYFCNGGA